MKSIGKQFVFGFVFVLSMSGLLQAEDVALSGNLYRTIAARNVFGLEPMPTNNPTDGHPADLPPNKITPNGLMSLFGQLQVLFKVSTPAKDGQPPKDESYVMSAGDQKDGIEVISIDETNEIITFKDHGQIQALPLAFSIPAAPPEASGGATSTGSSMPIPSGSHVARFGDRSHNLH